MSLINEALKRASIASPPPRGEDEAGPASMRPVEVESRPLLWPLLLLPVGLLLIIGVAFSFLWQGWRNSQQSCPSATPLPVAAREEAANDNRAEAGPLPLPDPAEVVVHSPAPSIDSAPGVAAAAPEITPPPAAVVSSIATVSPPPPPAPVRTAWKLQAIFYRAKNPSVVINSATLSIGDSIQKARVVAIGRDSVTLVQAGQTNVLTLR